MGGTNTKGAKKPVPISKLPQDQRQTISIALVGDASIGKTSLINWIISGQIAGDELGVKLVRTSVNDSNAVEHRYVSCDGKIDVNLKFTDTAGAERFRTINVGPYYRRKDIIILAFDLSSRESWNNLARWHKESERYSDTTTYRVIVGTKYDLVKQETSYHQVQSVVADLKRNRDEELFLWRSLHGSKRNATVLLSLQDATSLYCAKQKFQSREAGFLVFPSEIITQIMVYFNAASLADDTTRSINRNEIESFCATEIRNLEAKLRFVSKSEIETYADNQDLRYFITSAKTGEGIERMLDKAIVSFQEEDRENL